ncbi:MAG: cytidine deaminase [Propionibacteriaceae bacterium]|jgi:cytidine deaminase|nr:cytidine deaminase [Propionibacteriaceae bacterium]
MTTSETTAGCDKPSAGVDWNGLLAAARQAATRAHAPYSNYPVGAAALTESGKLVTGCNVENASLGLTLCAECGLVSQLVLSGGGRLAAFTCVNAAGEVITPCGRCRQLLLDHGGLSMRVLSPAGEVTLADLLPQAWVNTER